MLDILLYSFTLYIIDPSQIGYTRNLVALCILVLVFYCHYTCHFYYILYACKYISPSTFCCDPCDRFVGRGRGEFSIGWRECRMLKKWTISLVPFWAMAIHYLSSHCLVLPLFVFEQSFLPSEFWPFGSFVFLFFLGWVILTWN